MKSFLLLSFALCIGLMVYSQSRHQLPKEVLLKAVDMPKPSIGENPTNFMLPASGASNTRAYQPNETQIGLSYYDLWTNGSYQKRFTMFEDGTMAAVWIYGEEATAFPDRGTGYNYYDGTEWGPFPTSRIEDRRTGWPSHAVWGSDGEVVLAHNGEEGLEISWRATKGTGAWTQQNFLGPAGIENDLTWPRIATSGTNNDVVHIIANSYGDYNGQPYALIYSRSADGGATWNPQNVVLEETGPDNYYEISADSYLMVSRGNTIVMLFVDSWMDFFYLRSDDNGDNWEKTVIWEHPYPKFDPTATTTDTLYAVDNSAQAAIDANGKVHVVFGITRVINTDLTTTTQYYPFNDGIGYWNEDMNRFSNDLNALAPPQPYNFLPWITETELVVDYSYIGWMQDIDGDGEIHLANHPNTAIANLINYRELSLSTMPSISVDDNGKVFVVFTSTAETYEVTVGTNLVNYKRLYARAWDGAGGWGPFVGLTEDIAHIFDECIYPNVAQYNNDPDNLYYIYMTDVTPGLALDDDHGYQDNYFWAASIPKSDLLTGIASETVVEEGNVSQNFPNPFSTTSTVKVTLEQAASLTLEISNLMGQKVYSENLGQLPAGTHPVTLDATSLDSGVYFYTIKSGKSSVTRRMIVE